MPTRGARMTNDSRGDRPTTDVIVEPTAHNLDLRQLRHAPLSNPSQRKYSVSERCALTYSESKRVALGDTVGACVRHRSAPID